MRHQHLLCLALLGGLTATSPRADSAPYYVAPAGNDTNTGLLPDQAWQTLQHAVDRVAPGDVVLLQPGAYAGARIVRSGATNAPITLRAEPGTVTLTIGSTNALYEGILELEGAETNALTGWIIEGLTITNAARNGIDIRFAKGILLRSNVIERCHGSGLFAAYSDDIVADDNTIAYNGIHGIHFSNSGDRPVARKNRILANGACGIQLEGDVLSGGDGIISGALIERNIIRGNGSSGGAGVNLDGVVDSLIRNNLIYQNRATGVALLKSSGAVPSSRVRILNNTVVMPPEGGWALNQAAMGCNSNIVLNNILWSSNPARGSISINGDEPEGFACDYNIVTRWFSIDNGAHRIDQHAWRALGFDKRSHIPTLDALFVKVGRDDYRTRPDSPAIDRGCPLPDVLEDISGQRRPQGGFMRSRWDIGAHEYTGLQ